MDKTQRAVTRRHIATLMGAVATTATFLRGGRGYAAVVEHVTSSRLTPLADQDYEPPTSLSAVADIYRRMTVPIGVGDAGPFPFVVDTGANQSVISQELAAQLGLVIGASKPINGVAGIRITPTTVADLHINGRTELGVGLSILPASAIGGAGMLGLDGLEGQELTLDFRGQALRIAAPHHLSRDPGDVAVKAHRRDGQLTLIDTDLAGIPLVAFLDSGAQNTIGNKALRGLAFARTPGGHWFEAPIVSATGQIIIAEVADLPRLRIGGLRLPSWPVAFADLHTFKMWDMVDKPAILIGVDILSRFEAVCLDFARNEVRFTPPGRTF